MFDSTCRGKYDELSIRVLSAEKAASTHPFVMQEMLSRDFPDTSTEHLSRVVECLIQLRLPVQTYYQYRDGTVPADTLTQLNEWFRTQNLKERNRSQQADKAAVQEHAQNRKTLSARKGNRGVVLQGNQLEHARRLKREGQSLREVARAVGASFYSVRKSLS